MFAPLEWLARADPSPSPSSHRRATTARGPGADSVQADPFPARNHLTLPKGVVSATAVLAHRAVTGPSRPPHASLQSMGSKTVLHG